MIILLYTLSLSYVPTCMHIDHVQKLANEVTPMLHPHEMQVKLQSSVGICTAQMAHHGCRIETTMQIFLLCDQRNN